MINFLLGDVGHGKSTYIINQIRNDVQNGTRSILLVPEQETLVCERLIASSLPARAQLYTEAINFTRLSNKFFREHGGLRYNYATKSDKNLIMYVALCEVRDSLNEYKISKGREHSCVKLFLDAIGELKSYSVTVEKLINAIKEISNENLKSRLNDLVLIWSVYERLLSNGFDDSYDDILSFEKKLECVDYFGDCNVYIDSFNGFTKSQLNVIYHIIRQAKNVTFAFDCPIGTKKGDLQYTKIVDARDKIASLCRGFEINKISFDTDYKHENKTIEYLAKSTWKFDAPALDNHSGIELVMAGDEFEECEYVASKIKELVMGGARYRDIAVIMRDSSSYKGLIDYSFKKYGIPFFLSSEVDIMSMPAVKMVFSALKAISSYRYEDIISYIKCGYTDITEDELNELESYLFRWNINGRKFKNIDYWASNPDGYVARATSTQKHALSLVHSAREKVLSKLEILEKAFSKSYDINAQATAVFSFLKAHGIKERIEEEIKGCSKQRAYELSQIWNILLRALDSLTTICDGSHVNSDDFAVLLSYALSDTGLGSIPSGEDVVLIGDAGNIRTRSIKHSFVMGVNEGVFPADIKDNGFFSDTDKITLESASIDLSSRSDMRADDELLSFKNAISCASSTVTVSCLKSNLSGKELQPSIAFNRIKELLLGVKIVNTSALKPIDKIYSEEIALEYLLGSSPALSAAIKESCDIKARLDGSGFANDEISIDNDTVTECFGNELTFSKSSLESFAFCKLKYYCSEILRLKSSKRISFASNDVGNLSHHVIEKFFSLCKDESFDASSLSDDDIAKIVDDIIKSYASSICSSNAVSKKLEHMFKKLRKNLVVYLKNLISELSQGDFEPEYFELSLSGDGENAPMPLKFKLDNGATASLVGVVDRVDIYRKDGKTYVRIVDYKSGSEVASREFLSQGFGLQMFIYLFTLCKLNDCKFKQAILGDTSEIIPAGIMYFPMNLNKKTIKQDVCIESDTVDVIEKQAINERVARSGFFLDNIDILYAQDKALDGKILPLRSENEESYLSIEEFNDIYSELENTISQIGSELLCGSASASPIKIGQKSPCKYCDHASVCRSRRRK